MVEKIRPTTNFSVTIFTTRKHGKTENACDPMFSKTIFIEEII